MMLSGAAVNGFHNRPALQRKGTSSVPGFSRKKLDPSHKNISRIRDKSSRIMPHDFHYNPRVSESFLEEWLDFPVDSPVFVPYSMAKMWGTWLLWNSKSMAGLDPNDRSIRSRVTNQVTVLGTAAGLFLVVAVAGFLVPPVSDRDEDKVWLDAYGIIMFTSSASLIFYIGLALTAFYPLIESQRDDVAFDAYETYQRRVGGYETYLFYVGMNLIGVALLVAVKVIYSTNAAFVMLGLFFIVVSLTSFLARDIFIALDPISAMHMGLTNDPEVQYRAELLSHFMLRKIPNSIVYDEDRPENDLFARKRESTKYEETRASMKLMTAASPTSARVGAASAEQSQPQDIKLFEAHSPSDGGVHNFEPDEPDVVKDKSDAFPANTTSKSSQHRDCAHSGEGEVMATAGANDSALVEPVSARHRDLRELFCGDAYLFQSFGLSKADSVAAYDCIVRSGCSSTEDLLSYLDHNKQARLHGVCDCAAPHRQAGVHDGACGSRIAAMWMNGLTSIHIPAFHAVKIVQALQKELK